MIKIKKRECKKFCSFTICTPVYCLHLCVTITSLFHAKQAKFIPRKIGKRYCILIKRATQCMRLPLLGYLDVRSLTRKQRVFPQLELDKNSRASYKPFFLYYSIFSLRALGNCGNISAHLSISLATPFFTLFLKWYLYILQLIVSLR